MVFVGFLEGFSRVSSGFCEVALGFLWGFFGSFFLLFLYRVSSGFGFRDSVFGMWFSAFGFRALLACPPSSWLSVFGFRLPNGSARSCKVIGLRHSVFAFGFRALNPTLPGTLRIMSPHTQRFHIISSLQFVVVRYGSL